MRYFNTYKALSFAKNKIFTLFFKNCAQSFGSKALLRIYFSCNEQKVFSFEFASGLGFLCSKIEYKFFYGFD